MDEIVNFINSQLQILGQEAHQEVVDIQYSDMVEEYLNQCNAYMVWSRDREAEVFADLDSMVY